jgi:hypothetical protein
MVAMAVTNSNNLFAFYTERLYSNVLTTTFPLDYANPDPCFSGLVSQPSFAATPWLLCHAFTKSAKNA